LAGLWFVVAGLTGSVLVWYQEIDEWLNPELLVEPTQSGPVDLDALLAAVQRAHPGKAAGPWEIGTALHPHGTLEFRYPNPPERAGAFYAPLLVAVDPYRAEVLASRYWGDTAVTWLYELHADWLLGQAGRYVVGVLGGLLLVSAVSGLVLWWPSWAKLRLGFAIKLRSGFWRALYDLHRVPGALGAAVLITLAVTGCLIVFDGFVRPVVAALAPLPDDSPPLTVPARDQPFLTLAEVVRRSETAFPDSTLRWIVTPDGHTGTFRVDRRQPGEANVRFPATRIWIDPYDGHILKTYDPMRASSMATFFNLLYPLHIGEALGLVGRWVWFILGFLPLGLFVTGSWLWRLRRRR
jgi:uncharacterized iron-regulated membrane protein